jgi:hypothetical protein
MPKNSFRAVSRLSDSICCKQHRPRPPLGIAATAAITAAAVAAAAANAYALPQMHSFCMPVSLQAISQHRCLC